MFSHPVYLFLRKFSLQDSRGGSYNPSPNSPFLAYQVSKMPNEDGSSRIFIKPFCDNMFGCQPNPYQAVVSFKNFVKTGQ
ncbi:hypothetical protein [Escherichia coli]|uniref:hypothetical protein n=1 Tax=Escherichia coli TaxID=562 RepID=UPI003314446E